MRVLLFATAYNGLCQRVHRELVQLNHQVSIELSSAASVMCDAYEDYQPDIVICPFLKHRIPDTIWQRVPCLVLHPGILGDRGPSSLDWAIHHKLSTWGATLLQANHDFDAGKVWATCEFPMRNTTKASTYRQEVNQSASKMIIHAVTHYSQHKKPPTTPWTQEVLAEKDCWRPLMKQSVRQIDWQNDCGKTIVSKINAADSFPGVLDEINGHAVYLFGAKFETIDTNNAIPGSIIGQHDEAICRATKDGVVWIKQLKRAKTDTESFFKLPAIRVLTTQLPDSQPLPHIDSQVLNEIKVEIEGEVAYLHFDFYNGAFNTQQCIKLLNQFKITALDPQIKVIVLMGGEDFWSNGIHLHCIENAENPPLESWRNINAINDFVEAIIKCDSVLTVAALKTNAGAGGAIVPLACDYVIARDGVVLNPHYQTMGLTGSEYWTYLLPKRVGKTKANALMNECLPLLASEALAINLVDDVFSEDRDDYQKELIRYCNNLAQCRNYSTLLYAKNMANSTGQNKSQLSTYRAKELSKMKAIFDDLDSSYHRLRYNFVHKISCGSTPARLKPQLDTVANSKLKVG